MDVTIIIVSFNTASLLKTCIESIYRHTEGIDFEIIVSDNNSKDASVEMLKRNFPLVKIIENGRNLGFGAANNVALKQAKGKYVLYLNSDTIILNNAVKCFYDYWEKNGEKEKLGAIGAMLISRDGKFGISYGRFHTVIRSIKYLIKCFLSSIGIKYFYKFFHETNKPEEEYYGYVDWVIGADLFVKNNRDAVFDERYFMYSEDCDLQREMSKKGLNRKIIRGPRIIHLEGGSEYKNIMLYEFKKPTSIYYWKSRIAYLNKQSYNTMVLKLLICLILILPWNLLAENGFHNLKVIMQS